MSASFSQRIYDKADIPCVRRAPELMALLYERTDQPWLPPASRLELEPETPARLIRLLKRVQPMILAWQRNF